MDFLEACEIVKGEKNKNAKGKQKPTFLEIINPKSLLEARKKKLEKKFLEMMDNPKSEMYKKCIERLVSYQYSDTVRFNIFKSLMRGAFDEFHT